MQNVYESVELHDCLETQLTISFLVSIFTFGSNYFHPSQILHDIFNVKMWSVSTLSKPCIRVSILRSDFCFVKANSRNALANDNDNDDDDAPI